MLFSKIANYCCKVVRPAILVTGWLFVIEVLAVLGLIHFLADRIWYGHAYVTVLRPSSVCRRHRLCETHCGVNGATDSQSTIYSVLEVRYEKWLGTKRNDLDLCLQVTTRDPNTNRAQYRKKNRYAI